MSGLPNAIGQFVAIVVSVLHFVNNQPESYGIDCAS